MKSIILISALIGCCFAAAPLTGKCPTPGEGKTDFEVSRYLGRWYEIKRSDTPSEKGVKCSTANYSLLSDGKINITNTGINSEGDDVVAHLTASIVNPDQPNFLNVEIFPGGPTASYWVRKTDYETYAVPVSCVQITPDMYSLSGFILSRTPTLDATLTDELTEFLRTIGVTELLITDRTGCTN